MRICSLLENAALTLVVNGTNLIKQQVIKSCANLL